MTGQANSHLAPFDRLMTAFVEQHQAPGAALAGARHGRLIYARGFGYADRDKKEPVRPNALFRIASISKPLTAVAVLHLVERGKLKLTDHVFDILKYEPPPGSTGPVAPRLKQITVLHLLQHRGGWDRDKSFDPMFRSVAIARAFKAPPPARPEQIIRYMMGRKLDFDPGQKDVYSNFGYSVLGRLIEKVTGLPYEAYVRKEVLAPLGIHDMRLGKTLPPGRAPREVKYYDEKDRTGGSVFSPHVGAPVPLPYGAWCLEAMDSHGGWIASADNLVRFASAFDVPARCKVLRPSAIATMFARPEGSSGYEANGKPRDAYYACGWMVRPVGPLGRANTWHNGALDGTATILVRRHDGLCWAVLFSTRNDPDGKNLAGEIDGLVHEAADRVKVWPQGNRFKK
jgi:N-acyl-D-amino-acid deacylase